MTDPDRAFWVAVRAALLAVVDAIERRWLLGKHAPGKCERLANETVVVVTGTREGV